MKNRVKSGNDVAFLNQQKFHQLNRKEGRSEGDSNHLCHVVKDFKDNLFSKSVF